MDTESDLEPTNAGKKETEAWDTVSCWLNARRTPLFQPQLLTLTMNSACVFDGLRVSMNVKLLRTQDRTYVSALMALYTVPECTSGFLVLCLPVFPKFLDSTM